MLCYVNKMMIEQVNEEQVLVYVLEIPANRIVEKQANLLNTTVNWSNCTLSFLATVAVLNC